MTKSILTGLLALVAIISEAQQIHNARYPFEPASVALPESEQGIIMEKHFSDSKIYPGTERTYWVYVPRQYTGEKPACLYLCMDGIQNNAPTAFDNLIKTGEMPVTIGVFVSSGTVRDAKGKEIRYNGSNEFDKTDDTFAHFLETELLPDVEKMKTSDGHPVRLSKDANDCAIAGASSGAIAAFKTAWERPDMFSRIFSSIGTYVAMRGGNDYPALVRKTEPKALRIYLQDGVNDIWNPIFGHWFEANTLMESALNFAGYEMTHNWGRGGHDGIQADQIFPDVMRWLWKGWPEKVKAGTSMNDMLTYMIEPGETWQPIELPLSIGSDIYPDDEGCILFQQRTEVYRVLADNNMESIGKLGQGEKLVGTSGSGFYTINGGTLFHHQKGKKQKVTSGFPGASSVQALANGSLYVTQSTANGNNLWLVSANRKKKALNTLANAGEYTTIYPNYALLIQTEQASNWLNSYVIDENGEIKDGQRFYWLHNVDNHSLEKIREMAFDTEGNLYVSTPMGIQVCDQNGRVRAILTIPSRSVEALAFAGADGKMLYMVSKGQLYKRKLKSTGHKLWQAPVEPQSQGAG
ncbi:MAG: hypothetical protein LUD46_17865 [Parabacteroides sp.]|nr:hypothetical protein [Parabacteroides sp.]